MMKKYVSYYFSSKLGTYIASYTAYLIFINPFQRPKISAVERKWSVNPILIRSRSCHFFGDSYGTYITLAFENSKNIVSILGVARIL